MCLVAAGSARAERRWEGFHQAATADRALKKTARAGREEAARVVWVHARAAPSLRGRGERERPRALRVWGPAERPRRTRRDLAGTARAREHARAPLPTSLLAPRSREDWSARVRGTRALPRVHQRGVYASGCGWKRPVMILPQVHLRKPCYDFSFL